MPDLENEKRPENGGELIEVIEPEVMDDEIRRLRSSRMECRCCGCSGTAILFLFFAIATLLIYYFFFRS